MIRVIYNVPSSWPCPMCKRDDYMKAVSRVASSINEDTFAFYYECGWCGEEFENTLQNRTLRRIP